ncbi:hypothetical protein PFICI_12312 [Pestalotiopsis fici W106-1]|uniref:Uncharacterized protein n=1 Tax=Pestalotiopsis fici (strain W106-1 / CGMCC3.15140) TaxID=1229662 RepID=W3WND5_PESFW|nr:uncharacterized protein PFICI_12312 [Pestalotiopsis fici W106-1]ETS75368.1 hypothetical protein PFICI_12312 [Pestalotiopsis fici W106-1]
MQRMDSEASRKRKYSKKLRNVLTKFVGQFRRKSSDVSATALATPSGGSQPRVRPDIPSENIPPAADSHPGDNPEALAITTGRPAEPAILQPGERHESTVASAREKDANKSVFEGSESIPCFNEAVKSFKSMYEDRYKAIFDEESSILDRTNLKSGSDLADQRSQYPMGGIESLIQRFKTYLPTLGSVQTLAMALSRLDPHGIAPLVAASVFFVIQASFYKFPY